MKRLFIIVIVASAMLMSLSAQSLKQQSTQTDSVEQQLVKLEHAKDEAKRTGDRATLDRLYADDYVATNAKGGSSNKDDILKHFASNGSMYESYKSEDIKVRVFDNTAVVTGRFSFSYDQKKMRGKDSGKYRFINVYVKREGAWQIVASQFTLIEN